jgi:hypothetical protein
MHSKVRTVIHDSGFLIDGVGVSILVGEGGERRIVRLTEAGLISYEEFDPSFERTPTFSLPNDLAMSLLEALLRHYQGASDMHTVRADLLHERKRVDGLIESLTKMCSSLIDNG